MRKNSLQYHLRIISTKPHILNWFVPFFTLNNPKEYLRHFTGFGENKVATYHFKNGLQFKFQPRTKDTAILVESIRDTYLPPQIKIDEQSIVIDIGAHIGAFTIPAAKLVSKGRVYAFEPGDVNFALLEKNVLINNLTNVSFEKYAISDSESTAELLLDPSNTGMNSIVFEDDKAVKQTVQTKTLESVIEANKLGVVDLLKIDTEGSEYKILYSLPVEHFPKIKQISVEYHQVDKNDQNGNALSHFLKDKGYVVKKKSFPGAVIGMLYASRFQ
jgi:FkbM family methyltransferase